MLITRECDYALRIARSLNVDSVTPIATIVAKEHITNAIAYKVAHKLEKAGIIKSVRGSAGGYLLARELDDITILDIYKVMEPDGVINGCFKADRECPLNCDETPCLIHKELQRIQSVLFDEMDRKSLGEILENK